MEFKRRPTVRPRAAAPAAVPVPRRRRLWRLGVRLTVAGLLALAALVLLAGFFPWSHPVIDRWLQKEWLAATGLPLRYDRAVLQLSQGTLEIDRPALLDPASGQTLLQFVRFRVELPLMQLLTQKPPWVVRDLELDGPLAIELAWENGRLTAAPPWDRVWTVLATHWADHPEPVQDTHFGLREVTLRPIDLKVVGELDGERRELIRLEDASLQADFEGTLAPRVLLLDGRYNFRAERDSLRLALRPNRDGGLAYTLLLPNFSTQRDIPWATGSDVQARRFELKGSLQPAAGGRWQTEGRAAADWLALVPPAPLPPHLLGGSELAWAATFDSNTLLFELRRLDLRSDLMRLNATGTLTAQSPFVYDLNVAPAEFLGQGFALLAARWPLLRNLRNPERAQLRIEGRAQGDLLHLRPEQLDGRLSISGVDWQPEALPLPLQNLQLEASLTSGSLAVEDLKGVMAGLPVRLSGAIDGSILDGRVDRAALNWTTVGDMAGLAALIEVSRARGLPSPLISGRFTGQGRLGIGNPLEGRLTDLLDRIELEGELRFQNGRVEAAGLPAPLENLSGLVRVSTRELSWQQLRGRTLGLDFVTDGALAGHPGFWQSPRLDGQVRVQGGLEGLGPRLVEAWPGWQALLEGLPPMRGSAEMTMNLNADLSGWHAPHYWGRLALTDFVTTPTAGPLLGPIRLTTADLSFTSETLRLSQLEGTLGEVKLSAQGDLQLTGGRVAVRLEGPLQAVKAQTPLLLKDFQVDGRVVADHLTRIETHGELASAPGWLDLLPLLSTAQSTTRSLVARLAPLMTLHHSGQIEATDIEMTHTIMPTRLRHMTGLLQYDDEHLWTPSPVAVEGGEGGRDLVGTLDVIYNRPGTVPTLRFTGRGGHFPLSNWCFGWKAPANQPRHAPDNPPFPRDYQEDRNQTPFFIIEGAVESESATFLRVQGTRFRGSLTHRLYRDQPHMLNWSNVSCDFYGGTLRTDGQAFNWLIEDHIDLDNVDLGALAKALDDAQRPHGIFSGLLTGYANLRAGYSHFESPLQGEGDLSIQKSRLVSNAIFKGLGGLLRLPIFDDITFSDIHGPFRMEMPRYYTEGLIFDHPLVNMVMSGAVGPGTQLDLDLRAQFLQVANDVPLVGEVLSVFNRLAGSLLNFKVRGTLEEPRITPL